MVQIHPYLTRHGLFFLRKHHLIGIRFLYTRSRTIAWESTPLELQVHLFGHAFHDWEGASLFQDVTNGVKNYSDRRPSGFKRRMADSVFLF